jgi:Xaa-Pro aminopeptidase
VTSPPLSAAGRVERVRLAMAEAGVQLLIVSDLTNVRWLTGFTGSNGYAVVGPDSLTVVTDGRYGAQAGQQLSAAGVDGHIAVGATGAAVLELIAAAANSADSVGFEAQHLTVAQHAQWAERIKRLAPTKGLVESARRTKDAAEVARIAEACRIADAALAAVAPTLGDHRTEAEVRNELEIVMRELGATGPSYETIVATGPANAALPHHRPTPTPIEPGHTVIIDVGALVDGYHSDMTRSYVIGEPTPEQQQRYDLVLAAQSAGVAAVRPGLASDELDRVCRSIIVEAGYGDWFSHGTGHGVGLLIHEDPFINATGGYTLRPGDVVTVEPGLYRDGFGGFRVEDLVLVTNDGAQVLTSSPKDTPCLPSPPTI